MDALGSSGPTTTPSTTPPPEKKPKAENKLEQLFRSNDPAALAAYTQIYSEKLGILKDCFRYDNGRHDVFCSRVLQVALNCLEMENNDIDTAVEVHFKGESLNSHQLDRFKESAHALNQAFNFLKIIPPDEHSDDLVKELICLFWSSSYKREPSPFFDEKPPEPTVPLDVLLIELFKRIPPDQHLSLLKLAIPLLNQLAFGQESCEIYALFEALWLIPKEERKNIWKMAWPLFTRHYKGSDCACLLREVYKIPKEVREETVQSSLAMVQENCSVENKARILRLLAPVSKQERDKLAKEASSQFTGYQADVQGDKKTDYLEMLLCLPQVMRESPKRWSIRDYCYLVPVEARRILKPEFIAVPRYTNADPIRQIALHAAGNKLILPPDQFLEMIKLGSNLCEGCSNGSVNDEKTKSAQIVDIFHLMLSIDSPSDRDKYVQWTFNHLQRRGESLQRRLHFLQCLLLFPRDDREALAPAIGKFIDETWKETVIKALDFLGTQPEKDRADIFKGSVAATSDIHSRSELLAVMQKVAELSSDHRAEVMDNLWYVKDALYQVVQCIDRVCALPKGHRHKLCSKLYPFENKLVILDALARMPVEHSLVVLKYAKALKNPDSGRWNFVAADFIQLMADFPELSRVESAKWAYSLCSNNPDQRTRQVLNFLIQCCPLEGRVNLCSWFNQLSPEQIQEEMQWFMTSPFGSREDREEQIRQRYADKCLVRHECNITIDLEKREERLKFGF